MVVSLYLLLHYLLKQYFYNIRKSYQYHSFPLNNILSIKKTYIRIFVGKNVYVRIIKRAKLYRIVDLKFMLLKFVEWNFRVIENNITNIKLYYIIKN